MSTKSLSPATPVLADLLGARIVYVHAEPYRQAPVIETGTVIEFKEGRGGSLYLLVKPDSHHMITRWREEKHLLNYLPQSKAAAEAAA